MSTQYGWISASLFTSFWLHMFTSLIETIAWIFWWLEDGNLFGWWASTIGWWGAVAVAPLPTLFAIL